LLQLALRPPEPLAPQVLHRTAAEPGLEGVLEAAAGIVGALFQFRETDRLVAMGVDPVDQLINGVRLPLQPFRRLRQHPGSKQLHQLAQQQVVEAQALRKRAMAEQQTMNEGHQPVKALKLQVAVGDLMHRKHQRLASKLAPALRIYQGTSHAAGHLADQAGIEPDRDPPHRIITGAPRLRGQIEQGATCKVAETLPRLTELATAPIGKDETGLIAAIHLPPQT